MRQLILFRTGDTTFALERSRITLILPLSVASMQTDIRMEQQSVEFKGHTISLIDLSAASNLNPDSVAPCPSDAAMIVCKASTPFAILADKVEAKVGIKSDQLEELPPVFGDIARACFPKVLYLENIMALVIDPEALGRNQNITASLPQKSRVLKKEQPRQGDIAPEAMGRSQNITESPLQKSRARKNEQSSENDSELQVENKKPPIPTPTTPANGDLEAIVGKVLFKIIQKRVQQATAKAITRMARQQKQVRAYH